MLAGTNMLWELYSKLPFVPGLDLGRTGEERMRGTERGVGQGGIDRGKQGGDGERKREYLRALECQHRCSHFSQWTKPGPSAPWHDFSL